MERVMLHHQYCAAASWLAGQLPYLKSAHLKLRSTKLNFQVPVFYHTPLVVQCEAICTLPKNSNKNPLKTILEVNLSVLKRLTADSFSSKNVLRNKPKLMHKSEMIIYIHILSKDISTQSQVSMCMFFWKGESPSGKMIDKQTCFPIQHTYSYLCRKVLIE